MGPSRSGTTTLWNCLGTHPEISSSLIKEPFIQYPKYKDFSEIYFEKFYFAVNTTKYLLDGCPLEPGYITGVLDKLKKVSVIRNIKFIYLLRELHIRAFSHANMLTNNYLRDDTTYRPPYLDENDHVNESKFILWMKEAIKKPYINLVLIEDTYISEESMFITKLDGLKDMIPKILEFLGVENIKLIVNRDNRITSYPWSIDFIREKERTNKIWLDNYSELKEFSDKYLDRIKNEYGIIE